MADADVHRELMVTREQGNRRVPRPERRTGRGTYALRHNAYVTWLRGPRILWVLSALALLGATVRFAQETPDRSVSLLVVISLLLGGLGRWLGSRPPGTQPTASDADRR